MAYIKKDWVGSRNPLEADPGSTPITEEALDHLETQYDEAVAYTDEAVEGVVAQVAEVAQGVSDVANVVNTGRLSEQALNATIGAAVATVGGSSSLSEYSVSAGPILSPYGQPIIIAQTAGTTSGITSPTTVARTDAAFRYEGLNMGDTGSHYYFVALTGTGGGSNPWRVSFDFTGAEFEMRLFRASTVTGGFRIWVDGRPHAPEMGSLTASSGTVVKVTMPNAQRRRITLEFDRGINFGGLFIPASASVLAASTPSPTRFAVIGDSFVWGAGIAAAAQNSLGFVQSLSRLLAWPQTINLGVGGSGYTVAGSGGGKYADAARMTALTTFNPDVILVTGSQNDRDAAAGLIQSEAAALFSAIKAALPSSKIVASSMLFPAEPTAARNGFDIPRRNAIDAEIRAAATAASVPFIDASTWFNGTGRVGSPMGDGNADLFRTSLDWNHPSEAGHNYLARRFAPEIRRAVGI